MKITKYLRGAVVSMLLAATLLFPASVHAITAGSLPYEGENTPGTNIPAFNVYYGVPSVGNEADFIRLKVDGEPNSALRNTVDATCKTGDKFVVWFYVHNAANPALNEKGNGPGVAKNVIAKVGLPGGRASSFTINGSVTSSNTAGISDNAVLNCGNKQFKLKYVENSANAFLDQPNTVVPLPRAIVEGGTNIGTLGLDGNVWGCWEQRVWMSLKVEVEEYTPPPVSTGDCKVVTAAYVPNKKRTVTAKVEGVTNNATIVGYKLDFGDGTVSDKQEDTHTYAKDGKYTITGSVLVKYADGKQEWKTIADCQKVVEFIADQPPQPPRPPEPPRPPVLPNTGAGEVAGIFAAFTAAGATAHRVVLSRRFKG